MRCSDLKQEFLDAFYQKAKAAQGQRKGRGGGALPAPDLSVEHATVLETPSVRGALSSILGDDYLVPSFGSLHQGFANEQPFHNDGTDHALSLTTVRDHKPRRMICMFYPTDVEREMGPTAIVPRSHILGVNRAGFTHSENRLTTIYTDPANEATSAAFQQATGAFNKLANVEVGQPGVHNRLDDARELMGDQTLDELYLTVPAGSFVITHWDCYHRGSKRLSEQARFRPMFAFRGVVRMAEPERSSRMDAVAAGSTEIHGGGLASTFLDPRDGAVAVAAAAVNQSPAIQAENNAFILGQCPPSTNSLSSAECAKLRKTVMRSASEEARLQAAYQLGHAVRGGGNSAGLALRGLTEMFVAHAEEVRRAASHGLCVAGERALPFLLSAIDGTAGFQISPPSVLPYTDPTQNAVVFAIHAVGQLSHDLDEARAELAVTAVLMAMERALAEIESEASKLPDWVTPNTANPWPNAPLYFPVIERRRTLAEGCTTLGRFAQRARIRGERSTCLKAVEMLLSVAASEEPGLFVESYINAMAVRGNAATSLCRVFSGGPGAPKQAGVPSLAWQQSPTVPAGTEGRQDTAPGLAVLVSEAARRAFALQPQHEVDAEIVAAFEAVEWPFLVGERTKAL